MINLALVLSPFLRTNLTALLNATTDQTLMLLWLILVDLCAHGLANWPAVLYWDRNLHAFRLLEPVALGWVLGPNLASIAILLPELLADLLLLVGAFLLVLSLIVALLPEIWKVLLMVIAKKDRGHIHTLAYLLMQRHTNFVHTYLCSLWHWSSYSSTYLIFLTVLQWLTQSEKSSCR